MNDKQWAYKTKYRIAKAFFFTLLFHAILIVGLTAASGGNIMDWIPDFLKGEEPTEIVDDTPVA